MSWPRSDDTPVVRCSCHGEWTWLGVCTIHPPEELTREDTPDERNPTG